MNEQQVVGVEQSTAISLGEYADDVRENIDASWAESTKVAYATDWRHFEGWCKEQGESALPASPSAVAAYISCLAKAGRKPSTINRRLAAIACAHRLKGLDSPTTSPLVKRANAGIRRRIGTAQKGKSPISVRELRQILAATPKDTIGQRDRAMLLIGFAGAFRRSELAALSINDIAECPEGLRITVRRGKTDQEGQGMVKAIPYGRNADTCPVNALHAWMDCMGDASGPVFRAVDRWGHIGGPLQPLDISRILKRRAEAVGMDPNRLGGHSLRAGLATAAAAAGVPERVIMNTTGHRSERMVRRYIREGNLFRENAAAEVGL